MVANLLALTIDRGSFTYYFDYLGYFGYHCRMYSEKANIRLYLCIYAEINHPV